MRGIPPVQRIFAIHMFRIIPNFVWVSESFRCLLNKAITDILCQRQCNCTCTRKSSFLPIFKCMWLKYSDIVLQVWWKSSRIQQYRYTTNFFNDPNLSGSCSIRRLINDSITCFFFCMLETNHLSEAPANSSDLFLFQPKHWKFQSYSR